MTTSLPAVSGTTASDLTARNRLSAIALAAGGVGIVVGHLLTVPSDQPAAAYVAQLAAHRVTGTIGGLLTAIGAFLVVPGLAALLRLIRERGARLATAGAILAGVGITALGTGDAMISLVMGGLVPDHQDLAASLFTLSDSVPLIGLPFAFAPLFVLGTVLLGIALLRARTVPAWIGGLTILGALTVPFSTAGGVRAFLTLLPLGVAFVALGITAFSVDQAAAVLSSRRKLSTRPPMGQ
ncbi:DUF4386 family protein [Kribbella sp. NPDC051586]|uniref:DUF4386 family protein n=1 Tax=Kribbella sp. NPDC051586 TaxID=3364118 RepID=UPI00379CDD01